MGKIRLLATVLIALAIVNCDSGLKGSYNEELDDAYFSIDAMTYVGEEGSIAGDGEALKGLLKDLGDLRNAGIGINFALVPEDTYVRINYEDRYDLRRLKDIEVELRFPEETQVEKMVVIETYEYSTQGGDEEGDLNDTKPVSEGGPYAWVKVDYKHFIYFGKFEVKVDGVRQYSEDPSVKEFNFYDTTTGTTSSISKVLTQGSFAGSAGNLSRFVYYKDSRIGSIVESYNKSEEGVSTGIVAGNTADGIVLSGNFAIDTENTTCLLDDSGTYHLIVSYPLFHESGRETETVDFTIETTGRHNGDFVLANVDGSGASKSLSRVITRPSSCEEKIIRRTATVSGKDYDGSDYEINETSALGYTHVYGTIRDAEENIESVDLYRVSGQAVYR